MSLQGEMNRTPKTNRDGGTCWPKRRDSEIRR